MGIEVRLKKESGEVLDEVDDASMVLSRAASSAKLSSTRLLRYIVPWGDAVFNQAQAGDLLMDLRDVISENAQKPLGEHLLHLEPLVEKLSADPHVYLWFVGD